MEKEKVMDLIDRRAAIDALDYGNSWEHMGITLIDRDDAKRQIEHLPSAQPDLQPTCNQLATDCISRQAAIDAVCKACLLTSNYKKCDGYKPDSNWCEEVTALRKVPSVQSEIIRCKDCKYISANGVYGCLLERFSIKDKDVRMYSDDFCSAAERKEDEDISESSL